MDRMTFASGAINLGFNSKSSHTYDFKIGRLVTTSLPDTEHQRGSEEKPVGSLVAQQEKTPNRLLSPSSRQMAGNF